MIAAGPAVQHIDAAMTRIGAVLGDLDLVDQRFPLTTPRHEALLTKANLDLTSAGGRTRNTVVRQLDLAIDEAQVHGDVALAGDLLARHADVEGAARHVRDAHDGRAPRDWSPGSRHAGSGPAASLADAHTQLSATRDALRAVLDDATGRYPSIAGAREGATQITDPWAGETAYPPTSSRVPSGVSRTIVGVGAAGGAAALLGGTVLTARLLLGPHD